MAEFDAQKQIIQKAISDLTAGRDINIRDVTQIINLPQPERFIPEDIPANLPTSNTIKFVGREKKLLELHNLLGSPQAVMVTGLAGMGGVGKTELATQYAWLYYLTEGYPGGICWVRARNEDIGLQIAGFAREKFGLNIPEDITDPATRVKYCWGRWLAGNVLVVFDDVADYQGIVPYLPQEPRFKVLVTTRLDLDLPKLNLDVLDEDEALQLLGEWIGADKLAEQKADGKELALRLGYLPLALNLVGRYVRKRKIPLAEMLDRLAGKGLEHPALDVDKNDKTWTLQIGRGVKAAFELSWAELSDSAKILGMLLGIFAQAAIPWELPENVLKSLDQTVEGIEEARLELESLHLLQEQQGNFRLHQLIREFLRGELETAQWQDWAARLKRSFVEVMVEAAKIDQTLIPQRLEEIEPIIPHLKEVATKYVVLFGDEDQAYIVASSLRNFAGLYYSQGKYEAAEPLYFDALQMRKELLGDHPDTATSLNNLAALYRAQGKYGEAELLYRRSLSIVEKQLGADHPDTAISLNNLAELYRVQGKYGEAEPLYRQSLSIREKQLGADHPYTATSLNNLAGLYKSQGKYSEAEPLYRRSLSIIEKQLGADHPYTARSLNGLALLYCAQGKYGEAEPLHRRSLSIIEKQMGADHPDIGDSYFNLGALYFQQGQYEQAKLFLHQALDVYLPVLGKEHPNTQNLLGWINALQQKKEDITQNNLPQLSRRIIVNILKSPFYLLWQGFRWLRRRLFGR